MGVHIRYTIHCFNAISEYETRGHKPRTYPSTLIRIPNYGYHRYHIRARLVDIYLLSRLEDRSGRYMIWLSLQREGSLHTGRGDSPTHILRRSSPYLMVPLQEAELTVTSGSFLHDKGEVKTRHNEMVGYLVDNCIPIHSSSSEWIALFVNPWYKTTINRQRHTCFKVN